MKCNKISLFVCLFSFLLIFQSSAEALTEGIWSYDSISDVYVAPEGETPFLLGEWDGEWDISTGFGVTNAYSSDGGNQWASENLSLDFQYDINSESNPDGSWTYTRYQEFSGGTLTIPDWSLDPFGNYGGSSTFDITVSADAGWSYDNFEWNTIYYYDDPSDGNNYKIELTAHLQEDPSQRILHANGTVDRNGGSLIDYYIQTTIDTDQDGIGDSEEFGLSGDDFDYDGNSDGIADWDQANVTSMSTADDNYYITLETVNDSLSNVETMSADSFFEYAGIELGEEATDEVFTLGFYEFKITEVDAGDSSELTMILPEGMTPTSYYKFGPTTAGGAAEWYEFLYDPSTGVGAEIDENVVTLHLIDGSLGDDDWAASGTIYDIGAPAFNAAPVPEPATVLLLGTGLIGLAGFRRKRKK